ncbi:MAG: UDP-N-acetylglucosamine acyltransferase [Verrucomicrobiota bacterium]|jgi:UDP-N-acetylglucosamine acyltransferase
MIHASAVIHPGAKIDPSVEIGPHAVIDGHVSVGPGCVIGPHAYLTGHTRIGANNRFHAGCVIGDAPQDLKYKAEPTGLVIGDDNVFREHVTVHRANQPGEETSIGSRNYLMVHSHVGHNSVIGNDVIMVNGSMLAGHVTVGDRALLSGNCGVHQFVRIGTLSMMQGNSGASQDLPPFTVCREINILVGLNIVGLRRAGFTSEQRLDLKKAYHLIFRGSGRLPDRLDLAQAQCMTAESRQLIEFARTTQRGMCSDPGGRRSDMDRAGT